MLTIGVTMFQVLRDQGGLWTGQSLLVIDAARGFGHYGVQSACVGFRSVARRLYLAIFPSGQNGHGFSGADAFGDQTIALRCSTMAGLAVASLHASQHRRDLRSDRIISRGEVVGKVIAITNQKGGVGKTTTGVNLSASLAAAKRRVLLIDLDPQGNAAMGCGIDKGEVRYSSYDLLMEKVPAKDTVINKPDLGFAVIPANEELTAAEVELMQADRKEQRLAHALAEIRAEYDYIFIDCPPSLNMLTLNAMVAANSLLIPMQCEYYALEGISALMDTLKKIQNTVNPELRLEGILRTMFDDRNRLTKDVSEQLIRYFGDQVFRASVPRNIRLAEAPSHGLPVLKYDKTSRGATAYVALANEMIRNEKTKP